MRSHTAAFVRTALIASALAASASCTSGDRCSGDADCQPGYQCVRLGGIVANGSACVVTPDGADVWVLHDDAGTPPRDGSGTSSTPPDAADRPDTPPPFDMADLASVEDTSSDASDPVADMPEPPDGAADGSSESDTGVDMGPTCECKVAGDTCTEGGCWGASCDVTNPCPMGYDCQRMRSGDYACECTDPAICGVVCNTTADCVATRESGKGGEVCNTTAGVCVPKPSCRDDRHCSAGETCVLRALDLGFGQCRTTGTVADGDPCMRDSDCASAECETNICVDPCSWTSQCEPDVCVVSSTTGVGVCLPPGSAPCGSCDGSSDVCLSSGTCYSSGCLPSQCTSGQRCALGGEHGCLLANVCQATEYMLVEPGGTPSFCSTLEPCWEDSDCTVPATCVALDRSGAVDDYSYEDVDDTYMTVCATPLP